MAKYVAIKNPHYGINEDASPGALDDTEAVQMVNVLPHNPDQLERRGPFIMADVDSNIGTGEFVVGVAINGNKALVSYEDIDGARYAGTTAAAYFDGTATYQTTSSTGQYKGRVWAPTHPSYSTLNTASSTVAVTNYTNDTSSTPDLNTLLPCGRAAYYEAVTYFVSLSTENTFAKIASAPTTVEGTRVVAWAGANVAADSTGTATINTGSTALTFSVSKSNLTDTFITFDSDRTTTVPYAYRIVSGSGTTWTIEKPYGLGESAATNKAAAAFQIRSRDIPIQSPARVGVIAQHLDRLFVGRALIRAATGTLQPAFYGNALKWSTPLSPEKWPDQNVTLVGAEPNDWITGLITVGRHLVIFKRYSTYVMSGDSEDNFSIRKLLGDVGCIDSRSIVEWQDSVIWCSYKGVHRISPDLSVDELTQRKPGHGVRRTYQAAVNSSTVQNSIGATACVDNSDYLHVWVGDIGDAPDFGVPTGESYATYRPWPMSCYIPKKAWTRLIGTSTNGTFRNAASPRFFSAHQFATHPFGFGPRGTYYFFDTVTDPHGVNTDGPGFVVQGIDLISDGAGSYTQIPFAVDVTWSDLALNGLDTWQLSKMIMRHQVEYRSDSTTAGVNGGTVAAAFDPAATNTSTLLPTTTLGTFLARIADTGTQESGQTTYVKELAPTSSDQDAIRGQYVRIRVYDTSTVPTDYWKLFGITLGVDPGRPGRATSHLL